MDTDNAWIAMVMPAQAPGVLIHLQSSRTMMLFCVHG
jgi:hypothetical protein